MTDFIFGVNYNVLQTDEYRLIINHIKDAAVRSTVLVYLPWLILGRLDKKIFRKIRTCHSRILEVDQANPEQALNHLCIRRCSDISSW